MKFFHISDLHIGLRLLDRDLAEDQRYILGQIVDQARSEMPDAVIVAGDVYHKATPSPEAVALYDWFLEQLAAAVPDAAIMIIAGNHDEALRIDLYSGLLEKQNIHLVGMPPTKPEDHIKKVVLEDEFGDVSFWLLPFLTPARVHGVFGDEIESRGSAEGACAVPGRDDGSLAAEQPAPQARLTYDDAVRRLIAREGIDASARNVCVSHQFYIPAGTDPDDIEHMDSENIRVGGLGAIGADALGIFDYAALGHLHKPMKVGSEFVRYCGTPMQYSLSEAGQEKGIIVVDMGDKGDVSTRVIPLEPLHEIRKVEGSLAEVIAQASDDYASVTVEDTGEATALEMRDRIRAAFPNLISYTRLSQTADLADVSDDDHVDEITPFELCLRFLGGATEGQKEMLRDVIDEAVGAGNETD